MEDFLERLVLHATREEAFIYIILFRVYFIFYSPYPVLRARLTAVLCLNRLDYLDCKTLYVNVTFIWLMRILEVSKLSN